MVGRSISLLVPKGHEDELPILLEKIKRRQHIQQYETVRVRKDGTLVDVAITVSPIVNPAGHVVGGSVTARNITEKKRAEEIERKLTLEMKKRSEQLTAAYEKLQQVQSQLIQAEKLSSIGQMSAGVSHELNSPLMGLLGLLKIYKRKAKEGTDESLELGKMVDAAEHMAKIISDLNTFARQSRGEFTELDLNHTIDATLSFSAKQLTDQGIEVIKKFDPGLPKIRGDQSQLQQVVVNMVNNARDAMPQGGKFTIGTCKDKKSASIEFADTGAGIAQKNLSKIFDPFFTTKPAGKGTGLGLSIVHGIVEAHQGKILVESQPGQGARFKITFPVSEVNR